MRTVEVIMRMMRIDIHTFLVKRHTHTKREMMMMIKERVQKSGGPYCTIFLMMDHQQLSHFHFSPSSLTFDFHHLSQHH